MQLKLARASVLKIFWQRGNSNLYLFLSIRLTSHNGTQMEICSFCKNYWRIRSINNELVALQCRMYLMWNYHLMICDETPATFYQAHLCLIYQRVQNFLQSKWCKPLYWLIEFSFFKHLILAKRPRKVQACVAHHSVRVKISKSIWSNLPSQSFIVETYFAVNCCNSISDYFLFYYYYYFFA